MLSHNNVVNNNVFFPSDAQHVPCPLQRQFKSLFPLLSYPYHLACLAAGPRTCLNHLYSPEGIKKVYRVCDAGKYHLNQRLL